MQLPHLSLARRSARSFLVMFMCSKLYVAAFEGRTEEVTGLLTQSRHAKVAARSGRQSPIALANAVWDDLQISIHVDEQNCNSCKRCD
uniref:Secreted protein n=1 Tax=Arundo donax TaxID=35708 RepID=A0A0A9H437_ARUDO